MKVIDNVLPPPKTNYELWLRQMNRMQSNLRSMPHAGRKVIKVKEIQ